MPSDCQNQSPRANQLRQQHRHSIRRPRGRRTRSRAPAPEQHNPSAALAAATPEANAGTEVVNVTLGSRKRSRDGEAPQAEQPPLRRIRVVEREATHLWTTVKQYILDPEAFPEPQVSCPICMVEIAIRGLPSQTPDPYKLLDDNKQRVGIVLPCAHVFCQDCIKRHQFPQGDVVRGISHSTCPLCRADQRFPECIHLVPGKRLPIATWENASIVPLTKPELEAANAYFPGVCLQCGQSHAGKFLELGFNFIANCFHGTQRGSIEVVDPEWHKTTQTAIETARKYMASTAKKTWQTRDTSDSLLQVGFVDHYGMGVNESLQDTIVYYVDGLGKRRAVWSVPRRAAGLF